MTTMRSRIGAVTFIVILGLALFFTYASANRLGNFGLDLIVSIILAIAIAYIFQIFRYKRLTQLVATILILGLLLTLVFGQIELRLRVFCFIYAVGTIIQMGEFFVARERRSLR